MISDTGLNVAGPVHTAALIVNDTDPPVVVNAATNTTRYTPALNIKLYKNVHIHDV